MVAKTESPLKCLLTCRPDSPLFRLVRILALLCLPALILLILPSPTALAAGPSQAPARSCVYDLYLRPMWLQQEADLALTKVDLPDPMVAGAGNLSYILVVQNNGPADATGVTLVDTLPPVVTFVSALATQGTCTETGGQVTCDLLTISPGSFVFVQVVVSVPPSVLGTITNSAMVTGDQVDPNPANNQATEPTTIDSVADLSIAKTDDPDPVTPGTALTYELVVYNAGPSDAHGVVVEDMLPPQVTFLSATPAPIPGSEPWPGTWARSPLAKPTRSRSRSRSSRG